MIYAIYISLIFIRKNKKKKQRVYRLQLGLCVMHASKHMWERMKKNIRIRIKKEYVKTESEVRER